MDENEELKAAVAALIACFLPLIERNAILEAAGVYRPDDVVFVASPNHEAVTNHDVMVALSLSRGAWRAALLHTLGEMDRGQVQ